VSMGVEMEDEKLWDGRYGGVTPRSQVGVLAR